MTLRGALHALVALGFALSPASAGPLTVTQPATALAQVATAPEAPDAPGQPPKAAPGADRTAVAAPDRGDLPQAVVAVPGTTRPEGCARLALPRQGAPAGQRSERPSARAPPEDIA